MSHIRCAIVSLSLLVGGCASKSDGEGGRAAGPFGLKAYSEQGASKATLQADPQRLVLLSVAEDGLAIAFDYDEYGYAGPTGTELARVMLTPEELAATRKQFVEELAFATIDDAAIDAKAKELAAACNCTMQHGGDVGTMLIDVSDDGAGHAAYWRSDLLIPEGQSIEARTRLDAARLAVIKLRQDVLQRGSGLVPTAVLQANAALAVSHPSAAPFVGGGCQFYRDREGIPPAPDAIICRNFADVVDPDPTQHFIARIDLSGEAAAKPVITPAGP